MTLLFNTLLEQYHVNIADVLLLRHQEVRVRGGITPYNLWRDNRPMFEQYQSHQSVKSRGMFSKPTWASFVATPDGDTLFVGLYSSTRIGELTKDNPHPLGGEMEKAYATDCYELGLDQRFIPFEGCLKIEWGEAKKAWKQYASNRNKPIIELQKKFTEAQFPGLMNFMEPLSRIMQLRASLGRWNERDHFLLKVTRESLGAQSTL